MTYPPAPWRLQGQAILTAQLIDIDQVRSLIPAEVNIIQVFPGKTIGGVYLSSYKAGSTLEYHELIVVAGLVSYSGQWGAWISHIYVDHPDSVAGGREIWGLPKELAEFVWSASDQVSVSQDNQLLCKLRYSPAPFSIPIQLMAPCLSLLNHQFLKFNGDFQGQVGLISTHLEIPPESPFSHLKLDHPLLSVSASEMTLLAGIPQIID